VQVKAAALRDITVPRLQPAPAVVRKARLAELAAAAEADGVGERLDGLLDGRPALHAFVASVLDASPFLRGLILDDPARFATLLEADPEKRLRQVAAAAARAWKKADEASLMKALRLARQETALLVALTDLAGLADVDAVTAALTRFADAAIGAAVRFILAEAAREGAITVADPAKPDEGCGWILLGMGKLGAGELNYSSDIDLIVLYDPAVAKVADESAIAKLFVRFTRRLVHILQERTEDGYVFRTDLRLRPDPGATNIALSTEAALQYYESLGQNWERAALIKARPVAGDIAAGEAFLAELVPYIWRKYLDYAAIADIHSIKRQIHDFRGHAEVAVAGHNVKLGRGGIREIEFFVQTQQLIAGGRNPSLRCRRTIDTLAGLAKGGWIDAATRDDLTAAYRALRTVEHCVQMVADEQTHTLPEDPEALAVTGRMAGFKTADAFAKALTTTLGTVRDRYAALFEAAPSLTSALGSLVFTGDTDDPETIATLSRLGYRNPAEVTKTVRAWHFGRYPAMRSATARERLTEFVPALIEALATTDNADQAFLAFDRFLARLPAGVQLFSLLNSNPGLLGLIATMLATAPRLAETVASRAHVLDALIEPAFFGRVPDRTTLEDRLGTLLGEARDYEDILNRARSFGQEQSFLIGVRVLAGTIGARQAGGAYADLADVLVAALFDAARREFEAAHGRLAKGEAVVVAMGKLGGREMTAASDLDLIFLYDFDERATASDGERPLPGLLYFTRLTQRLLAALSAPTAEGTLYEVDFRLRPSGKSGPLATHIDAFAAYQSRDAWTWEHMALTRARVIAGDSGLAARAGKEIARALKTRRDPKKTAADILEMRAMIETEKGGGGPWDLKQAPGGLVDIEFVAQWLALTHGARHPKILSTETEAVLAAAAKAGLLPAREAEILIPALRLLQALTQVLRLCVTGPFKPEEAPKGLLDLLARAGELPDFAALDRHLRDTEAAVRASFERLIGKLPAKA
jgi:glutamate-ammonia-ligase adenylyltransferase